MGRRLLLASPHMSDEGFELEYVHDAFNKNWIAPLGENVNGFEADMAQYIGAKHTVALSAGTAAIHLAMIMCLTAKTGGAVNGGTFAPFILTVDWLGWICYLFPHHSCVLASFRIFIICI